jgi:hypothetical protein
MLTFYFIESFLLIGLGALSLMISAVFLIVATHHKFDDSNSTYVSNAVQTLIAIFFLQLIYVFGIAHGVMSINIPEHRLKYKISQLGSHPFALIRSGQSGVLVTRGDGTAQYISRDIVDRIERVN